VQGTTSLSSGKSIQVGLGNQSPLPVQVPRRVLARHGGAGSAGIACTESVRMGFHSPTVASSRVRILHLHSRLLLAPAWGAAGASSAGRGIRGCVKVGGGVSRVGVVGGCAVRRLLSQQVGFRVSPLFWSSRVLGGRIWASGGEFGENGIPGAPVGSDTKALISNLAGEQPTLTMVPLVHW
jgi:hypothetical protein